MSRVTLTARNVPTLAPGLVREVLYFDAILPGFYLAVSKKGVRSFGVFYRVKGRQYQKRLGRHPVMTLGEARGSARRILTAARDGFDLKASSAETLDGLVANFLAAAAALDKWSRDHAAAVVKAAE